MFRILLVLLWLAVTVFAIADWARTPEEEMPGRIPRMMWLVILLLTIPSFSIGSVVWLIVRQVGRAEAVQRGEATPGPGIFPRFPRREEPPAPAPAPLAPDDDPEFLFKLERDIRRRRAAEAKKEGSGRTTPAAPDAHTDSTPGKDTAGTSFPDSPHTGDDEDGRGAPGSVAGPGPDPED